MKEKSRRLAFIKNASQSYRSLTFFDIVVCMGILPGYIFVYHMPAWCPWRPEVLQ